MLKIALIVTAAVVTVIAVTSIAGEDNGDAAIVRLTITAATDVIHGDGRSYDAGMIMEQHDLGIADTMAKCEEGGALTADMMQGAVGDLVNVEYDCRMAPAEEVARIEKDLGESNVAAGVNWNGFGRIDE
jgi:hypothetical protein